MPLDATTKKIKDQILELYPKINAAYPGVEASTTEEDGLRIEWLRGDIWLLRKGCKAVSFSIWQGPVEVVQVAHRMPKLLDALDAVKAYKDAMAQKQQEDLLKAHNTLDEVGTRLRAHHSDADVR